VNKRYTGYLEKYLPLIESGLLAGVTADKIARDLYRVGARVHWTRCEEVAIRAIVPMIKYIDKKYIQPTRPDETWVISTPYSVEREIQLERGELTP